MADPPPTVDQPIVLVGLMGAGKSTVGRRLADRLGLPFVDADAEVERSAGLAIGEIFARFGETRFRDRERKVMARLAAGPPRVIAAGGGALVDDQTRRLLLEQCLAVWLDAEIETLAERVGGDDGRPLLKGRDAGIVLADHALRRKPAYALAPIRVRSDHRSPEQVVDAIIAALGERRR
jgi:shikimate kinase